MHAYSNCHYSFLNKIVQRDKRSNYQTYRMEQMQVNIIYIMY